MHRLISSALKNVAGYGIDVLEGNLTCTVSLLVE